MGGSLHRNANAATFFALQAARLASTASPTTPLRLYASEHAHSHILSAARLLGFLEPDGIRLLPVDGRGRLHPRILQAAVQEDRLVGWRPLAVIATVGTPTLGSGDPVAELAEICTRERLWLQYCAGGSLADWLAQNSPGQALPPEMAAPLITQVAEALAYAHTQGICHLDVKAANLLLPLPVTLFEIPRLLLADFGVARCWQQPSSSREKDMEAGTIWGTPGVMAPEQWHGMPSPACDQYALGVLAYTLLTGRAPFVGSPTQLCRHHLHTPPLAPSVLTPSLPPRVDAVVLQALAKDSARRFASICHFAQALAHALPPR